MVDFDLIHLLQFLVVIKAQVWWKAESFDTNYAPSSQRHAFPWSFGGLRSQCYSFLCKPHSRFWWDLHLAINHQAQRAGEDYPQQHHQPPSVQPTAVPFTGIPCASAAPAVHPWSCCDLRPSNCCTLAPRTKIGTAESEIRSARVTLHTQKEERIKGAMQKPRWWFEYNLWRNQTERMISTNTHMCFWVFASTTLAFLKTLWRRCSLCINWQLPYLSRSYGIMSSIAFIKILNWFKQGTAAASPRPCNKNVKTQCTVFSNPLMEWGRQTFVTQQGSINNLMSVRDSRRPALCRESKNLKVAWHPKIPSE